MTTQVTVQVPEGANYDAELQLIEGVVAIRTITVKPGDSFSTYIHGSTSVGSIREVPHAISHTK